MENDPSTKYTVKRTYFGAGHGLYMYYAVFGRSKRGTKGSSLIGVLEDSNTAAGVISPGHLAPSVLLLVPE